MVFALYLGRVLSARRIALQPLSPAPRTPQDKGKRKARLLTKSHPWSLNKHETGRGAACDRIILK